ncbi:hypothetical protein Pcinc_022933 [Petrolisthes cinctipes]|uniref:Uncharacterized protein n=1 Tax=Petrolisthes cinctipes TaxID=88211 RepID=A0AAE1FEJ3_PETCI|nr:hypothetical protein Pcinc_022933 [Petrolisthes cinctipes]
MPQVTEEQLKNKLKNLKQVFHAYWEAVSKDGQHSVCMGKDPLIGHKLFPVAFNLKGSVLQLLRVSRGGRGQTLSAASTTHGRWTQGEEETSAPSIPFGEDGEDAL